MKTSEKKLQSNRLYHEARTREELVELRRQSFRVAQRVCISCQKKFTSWGPGNRKCPKCTRNQRRWASTVVRAVIPSSMSTSDEY